jgi:uncharacterized protein
MIKKVFLKLIRFYQIFISPLMGDCCRFSPSCSNYCSLAIEKYGAGKGLWMGVKRICRCHPWNEGGVDNP